MKFEHTKGKWVVTDDHPTGACLTIVSERLDPLASLFTSPTTQASENADGSYEYADDPERAANARLMAEAPQMLELLMDLTATLDRESFEKFRGILDRINGSS